MKIFYAIVTTALLLSPRTMIFAEDLPYTFDSKTCKGTLSQKACREILENPLVEALPKASEAAKKVWGKPKREEVSHEKWDEIGTKEKRVKLVYEGIEINYASVTREIIISVVITGNAKKMKHGLQVGMKREEIVRLLGPGEKGENGDLQYSGGESAENYLFFMFQDGKVSRIQWAPYSG
jgi:hypothetical protein